MGPAGRTTLECLVLSGSLQPSFSVRDTGDGSGRARTLYFIYVVQNFVCIVRNFVCTFHNVVGVDHDFVCVLLNSICGFREFSCGLLNSVCSLRELSCGLRNVAYLSRNGHIGFCRIWVENDSAQSGKLDGWFAYLLCAL